MSIPALTIDRLEKLYSFPDFVKSADINEEFDQSIPFDSYADPKTRKFPCHTKSATYISNALFWEDSIFDDKASVETGQRLLKFASFWGIEDLVKTNILEKVASNAVITEINELPDNAFAIVDNGVRLYPMVDQDTVKLAGEQLFENRSKLSYTQRSVGATNILTKAAELDVEFDDAVADYLERAAGKGITTSKTLANVIEKRAYFYQGNKRSKHADALKKLAQVIRSKPTSRQLCVKVAEALNDFDLESGMYVHCTRGTLPLPEEECHMVLYKTACEELANYVVLPTGTTYSRNDLEKLGYEIATLYPHEKSKLRGSHNFSMDKAAEWLEGLPVEKARLVDAFLREKQIKPAELDVDLSLFR